MDRAPPRLALEGVPSYLLRRGLVPRSTLVHGPLRVEGRSRRNRNYKVLLPRGGLLVKQAGDPQDPVWRRALRAEADVVRVLASHPRTRRWTPGFVHHDAGRAILVTRLLRPATTLSKYHLNLGDVRFPADAARTAARALAAAHAVGARALASGRLAAPPRNLPAAWKLAGIPGLPPPKPGGAADAEYFRLLRREAPFYARVPGLMREWLDARGLVHGDVRWDNYLVGAGARAEGELNLRLVDWEMWGQGDPAWDVACHLAEHVRFWYGAGLLHNAETLEQMRERVPFPVSRAHEACRAFLDAYAREAATPRGALLARALEYAPFCLALVGFESLQRRDQMPAGARVAVALANAAAEDPKAYAREWLGVAP